MGRGIGESGDDLGRGVIKCGMAGAGTRRAAEMGE